jgi:hypothetical protein
LTEAGLARNAVYLVRPDGYIGLADSTSNASAIEQYFEKYGIRPATAKNDDEPVVGSVPPDRAPG